MGKNKKKKPPPEFNTILPNLLLGSIKDLENPNFIKDNKIKYILCCAEECSYDNIEIPKEIKIKKIGIKDEINDLNLSDFEEGIKFIDQMKEDEVSFVHCMRGRSRSASIVISYLIFKKKITLKESYYLVKSKRKFIGPNGRLRSQLVDLEKIWNKENSMTLEEFEDIHKNYNTLKL